MDRAYVLDRAGKKDCVLLGSELSDIDFFLSGVFSVVPNSAPLDLRMVSSYVSNFDGEAVFTELGNLIVNSKRGGRGVGFYERNYTTLDAYKESRACPGL